MFQRISIKVIVMTVIVAGGAIVMALSLFTTGMFRSASLDFQSQSVARLLGTTVSAEMLVLEKPSADLGGYVLKNKKTKQLVKKLLKSKDADTRNTLSNQLSDLFSNKFVNTGLLELNKIRLYDKNLNLLVESDKGVSDLPEKMPDELYKKATGRKGADRMKRIGALWSSNDKPYYSTLVPLGGLRLLGYTEVVASPVYQLKSLSPTVGLPVVLKSTDGKELLRAGNWSESENKNRSVVYHTVNSDLDKPALTIEALEDFTNLNAGIQKIQINILLVYGVLIALGLAVSLWILRKALFIPISDMVNSMRHVSEGDLTIQMNQEGLKEIAIISSTLTSLIDRLSSDVHGVIDSSERVASQVFELEKVASNTNNHMQDQRDKLGQMATAMEEMVCTVQSVAESASDAAGAANDANTEAKSGRKVVDETVNSIKHLSEQMDETTGTIQKLGQDTEDIGEVLDVIRGIADQTNLLALNAAIEAARAGEQGRGFAVVADEVRSLAFRTQQSTQEIQEMIENLQAGSRHAVSAMEENRTTTMKSVEQAALLSKTLGRIEVSVNTSNDLITTIASAAEQQSKVAEEINCNVVSIGDVAELSVQGAKRTTTVGEELTGQSQHLKQLVGRFKVATAVG